MKPRAIAGLLCTVLVSFSFAGFVEYDLKVGADYFNYAYGDVNSATYEGSITVEFDEADMSFRDAMDAGASVIGVDINAGFTWSVEIEGVTYTGEGGSLQAGGTLGGGYGFTVPTALSFGGSPLGTWINDNIPTVFDDNSPGGVAFFQRFHMSPYEIDFEQDGTSFQFKYLELGNGSVVEPAQSSVPEPSSTAYLVFCLLPFLGVMRKKRQNG